MIQLATAATMKRSTHFLINRMSIIFQSSSSYIVFQIAIASDGRAHVTRTPAAASCNV